MYRPTLMDVLWCDNHFTNPHIQKGALQRFHTPTNVRRDLKRVRRQKVNLTFQFQKYQNNNKIIKMAL